MAPGGIVGVEGSSSYGAPAARALHAAGIDVREAPPHLSRRERQRSRRAGKSDPGDALAIARVTLREPDLPPVRLADATEALGLLADARDELVTAQTRARNRLHAHLVVLLPGYRLTASRLVAEARLREVELGLGPLAGVRAELARDLLAEVRELGRRAAGRASGAVVPAPAGHSVVSFHEEGDSARLNGIAVGHTEATLARRGSYQAAAQRRSKLPTAPSSLEHVIPPPAASSPKS